MILVGGLLAGASLVTYARGDVRFLRLGYWTLLLVAFPAYIVMRIGAQWTYSREGWEKLDDDPTWLGIGFIVADLGALLVLIALIVGGIGVRRLGNGGGQGLLKASMIIAWIVARRRRRGRLGDGRQARLAPRSRSHPLDRRRPAPRPGGLPVECTQRRGRGAVGGTAGSTPPERPRAPHQGARDRPSDTGLTARLAAHPAARIIRLSSAGCKLALQSCEVLVLLPFGDLNPVLVPLAPLQLDVAREDVVPERALHELRAGELVDRLAE